MEDEYDFSQAERGRFYHKGMAVRFPVILDPDVREFLTTHAKEKGEAFSELVNGLLRQDIERLKRENACASADLQASPNVLPVRTAE